MEQRLFLDVVVAQGSAIFELLAGEDKVLVLCRDVFTSLDHFLDAVNVVGRFHPQYDSFACQRPDKDLNSVICPVQIHPVVEAVIMKLLTLGRVEDKLDKPSGWASNKVVQGSVVIRDFQKLAIQEKLNLADGAGRA